MTWKDIETIVNSTEVPCVWKGGESIDGTPWVKVAFFRNDSMKMDAILERLPAGVTVMRLTLSSRLGTTREDLQRLIGAQV